MKRQGRPIIATKLGMTLISPNLLPTSIGMAKPGCIVNCRPSRIRPDLALGARAGGVRIRSPDRSAYSVRQQIGCFLTVKAAANCSSAAADQINSNDR